MSRLISGEYQIDEQKMKCGELSSTVTLHLVTWEGNTDNLGKVNIRTFENFEQELKELLEKYAI